MTFPFPFLAPARVTPDAYSFPSVANVAINTLTYSATITPTGYDTSIFVSAAGAEISINGGAWSSAAQLVSPGQTVRLRMTAAGSWSTVKTATVSIGGRTATWSVQTGTVTGGAWDTGWTAGGWTFTTPAFFSWLRVQLWAPGGGGGGGGGSRYSYGSAGGNGGNAQFGGGPYATGGSGGQGGLPGGAYEGDPLPPGAAGNSGNGYGGDVHSADGGNGGSPGSGGFQPGYGSPGSYGGGGGRGGYCRKTYNWGQISASTGYSVVVQPPGAGGPGGSDAVSGNPGSAGSYGRCYIDWG